MVQNGFFTIKQDSIEIDGIEALVQFTRYRSHDQKFVDGLILAEDLNTKSGTTLYTKGIRITPSRVARLIKLQISQPKLSLTIKIKKNAKLIQKFRNEIKKIIKVQFFKRMRSKVYRFLLFDIRENIEDIYNHVLAEDEITMEIYKMLFICECSRIKRSVLFFNHFINVAIFSVAIASSKQYEKYANKDKSKLAEICKAGLFHNYGAITQIDNILNAQVEDRFQMYLEANSNGHSLLENIQLGSEVMDSIHLLCEYFSGKRDFLNKDDWTSVMTNIVLVAESFLRKESGLFGAPLDPRDVVDHLNVQMMEKKLNKLAVQVLTLGLNLKDIFDFYEELEYLMKECPYGNSGFPYPLEGFKSPTIFICKDYVSDCQYLEGSFKAVTIVKRLGELKPGRYHRCLLLTPKLYSFYDGHYKEIKKAAQDKDKPKKE